MITKGGNNFYRAFFLAAAIALSACTAFAETDSNQAVVPDACDLTVVSKIDEQGHLVDRVDYPFVNDPNVIASWKTVDLVEKMEQFNPKQRYWKEEPEMHFLIFDANGLITGSPILKWTKGLVIHPKDKTASAYKIKEIGDATYMFFELKGGDYTIGHRPPYYYVLKKVPDEAIGETEPMFGKKTQMPETSVIDANGLIVDKTDYPFENDPNVIGMWKSVDFVDEPNMFRPDRPRWKGQLSLIGWAILPGGRTTVGTVTWTKGLVLHHMDQTALKYFIKEIGGSRYMFCEHKGGDYKHSYTKPSYYVLKYEGAPPSGPAEQPPQADDGQFMVTFAEKIKQLNINEATPEQVIQIFGEPLKYTDTNKDFTKDNLPDSYSMIYPDRFKVCVQGNMVKELRYKNPGYPVYSVVVGMWLKDVLEMVGQPTETLVGWSDEGKSGVLYWDIVGIVGYCSYRPADKNVVFIFRDYHVEEIRQLCGK
jgi:hypothetical protein